MAQKNPLLDFNTSSTLEREFILIDNEKCFMRGKGDLNIKDYVGLRKMGKKVSHLYSAEDISEEELEVFSDTMTKLMNFIFIETPQATLDKLTDIQQMQIIGAFTELLKSEAKTDGEEAKTEAQKMRKLAKAKGMQKKQDS